VVERDHGKASACVERVPTHKMIDAMERLHTIGRIQPALETAPATAPPSPQATMSQEILARFGPGTVEFIPRRRQGNRDEVWRDWVGREKGVDRIISDAPAGVFDIVR
jgi:hypothetical protein